MRRQLLAGSAEGLRNNLPPAFRFIADITLSNSTIIYEENKELPIDSVIVLLLALLSSASVPLKLNSFYSFY